MKSIQIILVEDDLELLSGVQRIFAFSEEVTLIASYSNAVDFMNEFEEYKEIDLVILDIGLPGTSGIDCLKEIKPKYPNVQFMMWTTFEDEEKIFDALKAGASGYVLKSTSTSEFIKAIIELKNGGSPMSSSIARKVINSFHNTQIKQAEYNLSNREKEILDYLAKGYRYKEIADQLFLSTETVRSHVHHIYRKLQVSSRTDALNKVFPK